MPSATPLPCPTCGTARNCRACRDESMAAYLRYRQEALHRAFENVFTDPAQFRPSFGRTLVCSHCLAARLVLHGNSIVCCGIVSAIEVLPPDHQTAAR